MPTFFANMIEEKNRSNLCFAVLSCYYVLLGVKTTSAQIQIFEIAEHKQSTVQYKVQLAN